MPGFVHGSQWDRAMQSSIPSLDLSTPSDLAVQAAYASVVIIGARAPMMKWVGADVC